MEWLGQNWFWLLILLAFIAMHMFGHGGHSGHGHHGGSRNDDEEGSSHAGRRQHH